MGAPTACTVGQRNAIPPATASRQGEHLASSFDGFTSLLGKSTSRKAAKSPVCWKAKQILANVRPAAAGVGRAALTPHPKRPWQLGVISLGFLGSFPHRVMDSFLLGF